MLLCVKKSTFTSPIAFDQSCGHLASISGNQPLQNFRELNTAKTHSWRIWEVIHGTYASWSGHAIIQRWTKIKPCSYERDDFTECYGFAISVRLHRCGSKRGVSISLGIDQHSRPQSCYSIQWNLSFPSIIPRSADVFRYVQAGDLAAVRSTFLMGEASPHDMTLDGISLLHVNSIFHIKP